MSDKPLLSALAIFLAALAAAATPPRAEPGRQAVDATLVLPSARVAEFLRHNPWLVTAQDAAEKSYRTRGHLVRTADLLEQATLFEPDAVALPTADGAMCVVPRTGQTAVTYARRTAECASAERPRWEGGGPAGCVGAGSIVDPCAESRALPEDAVLVVGLSIADRWAGLSYCAGSGCLGRVLREGKPPSTPGTASSAPAAGPVGRSPRPADGLTDDAEIAAATFVDLDFARFPKLPAHEVPATGVLFVATDGDDAGPGTRSAPFRTIARALRAAETGTTIVVRGGDYAESHEPEDYRGLVVNKDRLTLMAHPGETVRLRPRGAAHHGVVVNAQQLVFRGIDVEGFRSVGILFDAGRTRNRHVVVADLAITGSEEAIAMWEPAASVDELLLANVRTDAIVHCGHGPCSSWRLENVTIDAKGEGWGADAFAVESGDNILIVGSTVLGAGSDGIDTKATRVVVLNSRIQGTQNNPIKLWHGGDVINTAILRGGHPLVVEEGRFRMLHSTIGYGAELRGHRDYSITLGYDQRKPMQVEIVNSIIANPSGGLWINPETTSPAIRHTLFYTADGSEILIHGDREVSYTDGIAEINRLYGPSNLAADPRLGGDLQPGPSSPAIDAGTAKVTGFPRRDCRGKGRVNGKAPDLGAFER